MGEVLFENISHFIEGKRMKGNGNLVNGDLRRGSDLDLQKESWVKISWKGHEIKLHIKGCLVLLWVS